MKMPGTKVMSSGINRWEGYQCLLCGEFFAINTGGNTTKECSICYVKTTPKSVDITKLFGGLIVELTSLLNSLVPDATKREEKYACLAAKLKMDVADFDSLINTAKDIWSTEVEGG